MKYFLSFFSALFMLFSCHPARSVATEQPLELTATAEEPEILFLQLKVWKKDTIYGAELLDKKQVKGLLTRDLRGVQVNEGQWLVSFLDTKKKVVTQVAILNPLEEHYEVADDQGQLRAVEVKKQEADCFIRVQYDSRFSGLKIEQIVTSQQRIQLFSINL